MRGVFRAISEFVKKADIILLALCITATVYGTVIISSATNYVGNSRYIIIQLAAMVLGIAAYVILTLIDVDIIAERRELLLLFCIFFIALLQIFGVERGGNRSWLVFAYRLGNNFQPRFFMNLAAARQKALRRTT